MEMKPLLFLLTLVSVCAQTQLLPMQIPLNADELRCPGPLLTVTDATHITIGANWSLERPCYFRFNLTPPASVDPTSVSSFTAPIILTIINNMTEDDEVYIYAAAPLFNPAIPSRIGVRVRNRDRFFCLNCGAGIEIDPRTPRLFPASSVPIGFALVRAGKFTPNADEIRQQFFIGPGAEMIVHQDQGGFWFEVGPAATQLALSLQAQSRALASDRIAVARAKAAMPEPSKKVKTLEQRVKVLEAMLDDLALRTPRTAVGTVEAAEQYKSQMEAAVQQFLIDIEQLRIRAMDASPARND
jgi:hypothetical protein